MHSEELIMLVHCISKLFVFKKMSNNAVIPWLYSLNWSFTASHKHGSILLTSNRVPFDSELEYVTPSESQSHEIWCLFVSKYAKQYCLCPKKCQIALVVSKKMPTNIVCLQKDAKQCGDVVMRDCSQSCFWLVPNTRSKK